MVVIQQARMDAGQYCIRLASYNLGHLVTRKTLDIIQNVCYNIFRKEVIGMVEYSYGQKLLAIRQARDLTREQAAECYGIASSTLFFAESDRQLTNEIRASIEKALDVSLDDPLLALALAILRGDLDEGQTAVFREIARASLE